MTGRQSVLGQPASPSSVQAPQHSASPAANPNPKSPKLAGLLWKRRDFDKLWRRMRKKICIPLRKISVRGAQVCRQPGATSSYPRLRLKQADGQNKSSPTQKYLKIVWKKSRKNQLLYSPSESGYRTSKSSEKIGFWNDAQ